MTAVSDIQIKTIADRKLTALILAAACSDDRNELARLRKERSRRKARLRRMATGR